MSDVQDLGGAAGERKFARHNMMAVYSTVEKAREALQILERKGVEAGNIELLGEGMEGSDDPVTNTAQLDADMATTGRIGKRSLVGLLTGALIGLLIGGVLGFLADQLIDGLGFGVIVGAALGGALFGGVGGAFYGGATGLPVSDAFGETFEAIRGGRTVVSVHSAEPGQVITALDVLKGTGETRIARFGEDGKLQE